MSAPTPAPIPALALNSYIEQVRSMPLLPWSGEVVELVGMLVASTGPAAAVGDFCEVITSSGRRVRVQVIGFRDGHVLSMPLEEIDGIQLRDRVIARQDDAQVAVGPDLLNRVLDGFGRPIDRKPRIRPAAHYRLYSPPGSPLDREHIDDRIVTGIRAIDTVTPVGKGQRMGIFGGSGVGKSTLLGAMSRHNSADVTVIALIGERNREVRAFIEHEMGPEGSKRSVVVCATSDRPAPLRVRACFVALAVAEYFRDQGANVLFIMDSVTRLAMAQREIGLAAGEPPSQKGYTPSVFNLLPKILERAGNFQKGSITGFFTVLVEHHPVAPPGGHRPLSRHRRAAFHQPAHLPALHSGTTGGRAQDSRSPVHVRRFQGPHRARRLHSGEQSAARRCRPHAARDCIVPPPGHHPGCAIRG